MFFLQKHQPQKGKRMNQLIKTFKNFICIYLITSILFILTGCFDATGIEELAYVVAIGLDIDESNELELSVQIATSDNKSSSDSSGSTSQSNSSNVTTIKCNTIDSGLALINNHISKKINLSHCQVIIISESLAKKSISEYIDSLLNNSELRNDCSIIISKCSAKDYLNSVDPALEDLTARYYESTINSAKHTGYTIDMTLFEFYSKMKDSCSEAYAIFGTAITKDQINNPVKENADYLAGSNPITDKDVIDNIGIAVFKNDKLVGELSGLDSICHILINNELKSCILSIPVSDFGTKFIDLKLTSEKKTKSQVHFENNIPHISVDIYLVAQGLTMNNALDYDSNEQLNHIESEASNYISSKILNYLYKTSKEYNSDICGFGKFALKNYLTIDDWNASNWLNNYSKAYFDVHVHIKLKSGNLFDKS